MGQIVDPLEARREPHSARRLLVAGAVTLAYVASFFAVDAILSAWAPAVANSLYGQLTLLSLYGVGLLQLMRWLGGRESSAEPPAAQQPAPAARRAGAEERRAIALSLGGGSVGAVLWLLPMCAIARDWASGAAILAVASATIGLGLRAALRTPQHYHRIARRVFLVLGLLSLLAVNLRWTEWMEAYRESAWLDPSFELPLWAMNVLLVAVIAHVLGSLRGAERRARDSS